MSATAWRAASSSVALRRASGCGPAALAPDVRNAVETVVETESGMSIPAWGSKCTQPSPSVGCRPRTRATSKAMQATLEGRQSAERSSDHGNQDRLGLPAGAPLQVPRRSKPGHLASHTSAVGLGFGTLTAVLLLVLPGTVVARAARLTWPIAVAVGPALTYGVVGLVIIPYGALGIPWNAWTALLALVVVSAVAASLPVVFARYRDTVGEARTVSLGPALTVAAGVLLGALLIWFAAYRGMAHWQSIPSTWDAVWHANEIRWILDTAQASSTHMGELRNVETHMQLYYPSTFHALGAVLAQVTGAAPATAYTLSSLAAAAWLFPVSAAVLTWNLLRSGRPPERVSTQWRTAGAAATAAALSASFTAVPYVEFDVAALPNLVAYGLAVPTTVLIMSCLRHRDRIPLAILALLGVFSTHITGGVVVVTFVVAWWLCDALWHPVRGRLADFVTLLIVGVPTLLALLPQFLGVLQQAEIIAGHEFVTHLRQEARAVRRDRAAHPPPQRLSDPEHPHRAGCRGRTDSVDQARLVAGGGLAAAGDRDRAFVGAVRRTGRHRHRQVQRPVLQRPAPALGGRHHADHPDGRDRDCSRRRCWWWRVPGG